MHVRSNWFANWSIEPSWLIDIETRFWNTNYEIPFTIFMHTIFELLHPFPSSLLLLQTFISLKQSTIQSNAKSQTINPPRLLLESIIISNSNSKPSTNFSIRPFVLGAERSTTKKSGRRNILERKTISYLQFPVVNYKGRKEENFPRGNSLDPCRCSRKKVGNTRISRTWLSRSGSDSY